jgi:hypothetical protein
VYRHAPGKLYRSRGRSALSRIQSRSSLNIAGYPSAIEGVNAPVCFASESRAQIALAVHLITPTNASVTFFDVTASRPVLLQMQTRHAPTGKEVYLLVVPMRRAAVNAPGDQLEDTLTFTTPGRT